MTRDDDRESVRIAVSVANARNRELLADLLGDHDVVGMTDEVPGGTDLCIVDETGLSRSGEALSNWEERQRPTVAPVVLLFESGVSDPWERYASELSGRIDAIVQIPTPKSAVLARIDTLLEIREVSQRLANERQLTEQIFDTSPLATVVLDPEGRIVRANQRAEVTFDLPKQAIRGATYLPGEWTAVDEAGDPIPESELPHRRVLETNAPVYGDEHAVVRPDGTRRWLSTNMGPISDGDGVAYVVGAIQDVTVRRGQAQELERQLDLSQKAQDIADVGAWEYDVRADAWYWTESYRRIYQLDSSFEPSLERVLQQYHPEDRPILEAAFERAVENGEPYDLELRLIAPDGRHRWVRSRGEPQYEDGDVVRVRGALQDVTDRKERELELRQMTRAVDEAPIGVVISDATRADNPLSYVNEGFVDLTGYSREEAVGRNCRFLQGEGTNQRTRAELRRAIAREAPVSVRIRNYRADGSMFWNRLEIAPVHDDDGEVTNYIGFLQDVTERVERERQLQILDRYLRHNMRNKMNVVRGLAALVQSEGDSPATEYAGRIDAAAATLLENMEKERKITTVLQAEPRIDPISLLPELRSTMRTLRSEYPDATMSVSGDDVTAMATKHIQMAFEELIENAIVHNDAESPTVEVSVEADAAGTVTVRIADDGPLIPPMETNVLHEADEETAVYHGQGLGLWLVYLIVRRSGGSLAFEAEGRRGNVVTMTLATGR